MTRTPTAALVLCALLTSCHPQTPAVTPTPRSSTTATVVYIDDGDTIDVTDQTGTRQRVRLLGIDAPEIAHDGNPAACGGDDARTHLAQLLATGAAGRTGRASVQLAPDSHSDDRDRYGRLLRHVTHNGTDLALTMLTDGYAEAWRPSTAAAPDGWATYQRAASDARAAHRGAWATCSTLGR